METLVMRSVNVFACLISEVKNVTNVKMDITTFQGALTANAIFMELKKKFVTKKLANAYARRDMEEIQVVAIDVLAVSITTLSVFLANVQ
jgi:hypothetical protein